MTFKIGDHAKCVYDFSVNAPSPCGKPWPKMGEVFEVRGVDPGKKNPSSSFLLFEGLSYTPEVAFTTRGFQRVRKTSDFSDLLNPKTVWVPIDPPVTAGP